MRHPVSIRRTLRNAGRVQQVLSAGARFGFSDIISEIGLDAMFDRGMKLVGLHREDEQVQKLPQRVRVRQLLEHLGPTFIKIGQILSTRPDLIPEDWVEEFRKLQDDVPPVAPEKLKEALDRDYPDGVEAVFDDFQMEPLAAGSMAQVHEARLKTGEKVVVKLLRPGIRDVVEADMEILAFLADFAEEHLSSFGYSPRKVVDEFSRELSREIDMTHELRATQRLAADFENDDRVVFAAVYPDYSNDRVLVMDKIDGLPLSRYQPGDLPEQELTEVVRAGTNAVLRQTLQTGFFHADPHPGNLFALEGGRIAFIDCGMTGHIEPQTQAALADLVQGVVNQDVDRVIDVVVALADSDPAIAKDRQFRADAWELVSRFQHISLGEIDVADLLNEFFNRIRDHGLSVPADLVFLIKAITTIQGVGEKLQPEFDFLGQIRPYVERLVKQRYGWTAIRKRLLGATAAYTRLFEELPMQVQSLLFDAKRSRLTVNLEHRGLDRMTKIIEVGTGNIANALIIASLVLGSAVIVLAAAATQSTRTTVALHILAGLGLIVAAIMGVFRVMTTWVSLRRRKKQAESA